MNTTYLSEKLTRINESVDSIRKEIGADAQVIEDVAFNVKQLNNNYKVSQATVATLNTTVAEKDLIIADKDQTITQKENELTGLHDELEEKESRITELNDTVLIKNTEISNLNNEVQTKDSEIATLNTTVLAKNTEISNLNNTITQKDALIAELQKNQGSGEGGGTSAISGLHLVETLAERNAIDNPQEGDLCVVNGPTDISVKQGDTVRTIKFPEQFYIKDDILFNGKDYFSDSFSESSSTDMIGSNIYIYNPNVDPDSFEYSTFTIEFSSMDPDSGMLPDWEIGGGNHVTYTVSRVYSNAVTFTRTADSISEYTFGEDVTISSDSFLIPYIFKSTVVRMEGIYTYTSGTWKYLNIGCPTKSEHILDGYLAYTNSGFLSGTFMSSIERNSIELLESLLTKFDNQLPTDLSYLYQGIDNPKTYKWLNLNGVKNICRIFYGTPVENLDVSMWDTSTIEDMSQAFIFSTSKTLNLSSWTTTSCKTASSMFQNCRYVTLIDIRSMELSKVENTTDLLKNVPTSVKIIVKNTTEKSWFKSKFSKYSKVYTADEYAAL